MKNAVKLLSLIFLIVFLGSCKKEGIGGNATLSGHVMHHAVNIPNATVYLKYGAKEFPGASTDVYDASTIAYGVGYDSAISQAVFGGIPVNLKKNATLEVTLPVVE